MTRSLFLLLLLCSTLGFHAQTISDCLGAIPLCDDYYSEDEAPLNTGTFYEWTGVCNLNAESNSVWYTFTVQTDGLLSFVLTPNDPNDDYDWALFDITNGGCEGIYQGGPSPEVSCNSWGTLFPPNGATGISTENGGTGNSNGPGDTNGPPFNADLPVTAGSVFALVVMNWSLSLEGYSIDFGQSTASLYDDQPPSIVSVTSNCANTELTVVFSEPILVSTVQNEDFAVDGPGGSFTVTGFLPSQGIDADMDNTYTIYLNEQITDPGSYEITITIQNGQVEDACGNLGEGTFIFDLSEPMTFETEVSTACNGSGGSIEITGINGGEGPYDFLLNGQPQGSLTAGNLADGSYTVSVSDAGVCDLSQTVVVPDNLIDVSFGGLPDTLSCLHPVVLIDQAQVNPEQPVSWQWTTSNGHVSSGQNASVAGVDQPGSYTVEVTNTTNGCTATATIFVVADDEAQFDFSKLVLPNIVTPNNDSRNEKWAPFLSDNPEFDVTSLFDEYSLLIYNRWGQLEFESSAGVRTWDAADAATGNYFFVLTYSTQCGDGAKGKVEGYIQVVGK